MPEVNHEVLTRRFPKEAIKQRKGANGLYLNYVEAHSVIRRLIEATNNNFNFRVLGIDQTADLVMATVELEIGGSKRQHVGTARTAGNPDDAVKAAISDAIKKCATLFGVALELYGTDYEADMPTTQPARPAQPQSRQFSGNGNGNGRRETIAASASTEPTRRIGFRPVQSEN